MTEPELAARRGLLAEISVAARKVRTMFDGLVREQGLNLSRARLLLHLAKNESANQTELASVLEVEHPTVVRLLDGLERQGLIARGTVDGDRRAKLITLTEEAQRHVVGLQDTVEQMSRVLLADITEEDLSVTSRVLNQLIRAVEAQPPGGFAAVPGQGEEEPHG